MSLEPITIETYVGDTLSIVFKFNANVDAVAFSFVHSEWGTISATGSGRRVSIPVTKARGAVAASTAYTYYLVANDGIEGSEQLIARGPHRHLARAYTP